jgi:ferrochelatase
MADAGIRRAVGLILSPHATEASRERYIETVDAGRAVLGARAPEIHYVPTWHLHPLFIQAVAENVGEALDQLPPARRADAMLVFTAHSVPTAMAAASPYVAEITASSRAVAERLGHPRWQVAYQSRSGSPRDPWLGPDVNDALRTLAKAGTRDVVIAPIGFVCDHIEVLYDLDVEARATAAELGIGFVRASAVNAGPRFVAMLADVVRTALR